MKQLHHFFFDFSQYSYCKNPKEREKSEKDYTGVINYFATLYTAVGMWNLCTSEPISMILKIKNTNAKKFKNLTAVPVLSMNSNSII